MVSIHDRNGNGGRPEPDTTPPTTSYEMGVESVVNSGSVTLVEGSSFCRSAASGDMFPHQAHGLFYHDTRIISHWELSVDGEIPESLSVQNTAPFSSTFIARAETRPGHTEPTVLVERERTVQDGMKERLRIRNFGSESVGLSVTLAVSADFADLFTVKDHRPTSPAAVRQSYEGESLELSVDHGGQRRGVTIRAHGALAFPGLFTWRITVPPRGGEWETAIDAVPSTQSREARAAFPLAPKTGVSDAVDRLQRWKKRLPTFHADWPVLQRVLNRSVDDLGALLIGDPSDPELDIVAAGAPWFMTLFGRDSLLTSTLVLPFDLGLSRGVLHALANLQGRRDDPLSEEQPGRIVHEVRRGIDEKVNLGGSHLYYGTADATPLFVMLLGQATRWGLPSEELRALLPAADRALTWMTTRGDMDGDGFIEYMRTTDRGLINQGWKDSHDSMVFEDGTLARGPIALAEVQGYAYGAFMARAEIAERLGDAKGAQAWREHAGELRKRFNEQFWLPERGYFALALDGDKRPVDSLASNQGHCLWSGIVDEVQAPTVVEALTGPTMASGWGVRTLASNMAAYNPVSYHNGSVWPHDTAMVVAGLVRYGFTDEAARIADDVITASRFFDARLPELFCGFERTEFPTPVSYPTSCSPQAWASAAPLGLVSALLGFQPDVDGDTIHLTSTIPEHWGRLRIEGLPYAGSRVDIDTDSLPHGKEVSIDARQPSSTHH